MKILAISGSLRAASYNTALLRAAAGLAPEGVEIELYDDLESLPPYNEDRDTDEPPARSRGCAGRSRPRMGFCSRLLNTTRRCRDRSSRSWTGPRARTAPAPRCGASRSPRSGRASPNTARCGPRITCATRSGSPARECSGPSSRSRGPPARFDGDGRLTDPKTRERLADLLQSLAEHRNDYAQAA